MILGMALNSWMNVGIWLVVQRQSIQIQIIYRINIGSLILLFLIHYKAWHLRQVTTRTAIMLE